MNQQEIVAEAFEQLRGSWRYRWPAITVAWVICLVGWGYVYAMPDLFHASARVYVDTNSLLKPLMQGLTAQGNTMSEVQLISTAVLTRPNLERVARETDLALRAKSSEQFEGLISGLQRRIHVSGGRDNIFAIEFEDNDREKARAVVAAVLDRFVEGAIGAQGNDSDVTEKALAGELQEHEERLRSAETGLADFKKQNLGFMPGESGDYYTRLQTALAAVSTTEEKIRQLEQRRTELTRQIEGEEPVFGLMSAFGGTTTSNCAQSTQITTARAQLADLLVTFTDKHPRVVALRETIQSLEQRCAAEAKTAPTGRPATTNSEDSLEINPVYQNLRVQLSNTDVELVEARSSLQSAQATVATLRRDVDKIAEVEAELKQLNRDYDVVQKRHQELLRRWEDLQAKKRLDPVTDNGLFRRIEPPFARMEPVGPNRPLLLGGVLAVAIALGGLLAFGMNKLHPVCFSRRTVRRVSGIPVLGAISLFVTSAQQRRLTLAAYGWAASFVLLCVLAVVVIGLSGRATELIHVISRGALA